MADLDKWIHVAQRHIGKQSTFQHQSLMADIVAVDCGIKTAYLYDIGAPVAERLLSLLQDLKKEELIKTCLNVLQIDLDCLILNPAVCQNSIALDNLTDKLVDVSKSVRVPCMLDSVQHAVELKKVFENILNNLDHSVIKLYTWPLQIQFNVSSLFGLLLNYPIIYWYNTLDDASEICLSMEKLTCVKVILDFQVLPMMMHDNKRWAATCYVKHCLFSFSYPSVLESHCKHIVQSWFSKVYENVERTQFFKNAHKLTEETVSEAVNL